jgi:hypothetical protein
VSKKTESDCGCDCSGKGSSTGRAVLAGAFGGIIGVAVVAGLVGFVLRRMGPQVMERMMRDCDCPAEMKECMDRCCCGGSCDADETSATEN